MINPNFCILNLNEYNLSYDFLKIVVGIDVSECYPYKNGFFMVDQNGNKYLLFKIFKEDVGKYIQIFEVLKNINSSNKLIQDMYCFNGKKYFTDNITNEDYIVFNYPNGEHNKWNDFDFNLIKEILIDFYNASRDILKDYYNFNLKEDVKLLTIGDEIKYIDNHLLNIQNIEMFILYKHRKNKIDNLFLENKIYMEDELIKIREFFTSYKFKNYVSDYKNIRFINGNLSNKSFVFNDGKCYIANFYNASIDLFVKDIAVLSEKVIFNFNIDRFKTFLIDFLNNFEGDIKEHLEVLFNYIKLNNRMFKWFDNQYKDDYHNSNNSDLDNKMQEISDYKQKRNYFINKVSFT